MKTVRFFLAPSIALLLFACQRPSSHHDHGSPASRPGTSSPGAIPASGSAVPQPFQASLGKVYAGYLAMQAALDQDDLPKAKEAFHSLHAILHTLPLEGLDGPALTYWRSTDARIMAALHPLASSESLDTVRSHAAEFGAVMREAMGRFGMVAAAPPSGSPSGSGLP